MQLAFPAVLDRQAIQNQLQALGLVGQGQQIGQALAQQLVGAALHQAIAGAVRGEDAVLGVGHEDRVNAGLEHLGRQAQPLFVAQALGDVAEREHAPYRHAPSQLRLGHALEHAPVDQPERVAGLKQAVFGDFGLAPVKALQILDLAAHRVVDRTVVALRQQVVRNAPEMAEQTVEGLDFAAQGGHQDAVGGGLQRGAHLGQQTLELFLRLVLRAAVQHGPQEKQLAVGTAQTLHPPLDHQQAAVGARQHRLRMQAGAALLTGFGMGNLVPEHLVLRRHRQFSYALTEQHLARFANQLRRRLVHRDQAQRPAVDQANPFQQGIQQRGVLGDPAGAGIQILAWERQAHDSALLSVVLTLLSMTQALRIWPCSVTSLLRSKK